MEELFGDALPAATPATPAASQASPSAKSRAKARKARPLAEDEAVAVAVAVAAEGEDGDHSDQPEGRVGDGLGDVGRWVGMKKLRCGLG